MKSFYIIIIASAFLALIAAVPLRGDANYLINTLSPTSSTSALLSALAAGVAENPPVGSVSTTKTPRAIIDVCGGCMLPPFPAGIHCAIQCNGSPHRHGVNSLPVDPVDATTSTVRQGADAADVDLDERPPTPPLPSDLELDGGISTAIESSNPSALEQGATAGLLDTVFGSCRWPMNFFFGCELDENE
ncbi:uncharacterized protein EKO05_0003535 [Ascochyta rabiei]|uniref:Uncharacterized protein n=1 Tax=Didymella rabiei TaxID=5454 RepID=A0A163GBW2_DIDRA|nr:uncharacterized protein EKO05_0003535 [Ascochyta rabiei]KZM24788.1 hypothetical protein ST47_g4015 [Ascochyta rabiei]UPX13006.1 hypothetical protein EKO05_0003535 [Ascochyta rabiei]